MLRPLSLLSAVTPALDRRYTSILAIVVIGVCVAGVVPTGVAAAPLTPTVTDASAGQTVPGGNVTVTVTTSGATEVDLTNVPASWEVTSHRDDWGDFVKQLHENHRVLWFWSWPVSANVSVTFRVPDEANRGTYHLKAVPYAGTTRGESTTITVSVAETEAGIPSEIAGSNNRIDLPEVLEAITLYNTQEPVPGTNGRTITTQVMLRIISLYNTHSAV